MSGSSWTPTGTKANLTYSFLKFKPEYAKYTQGVLTPFTSAQQQAALRAMHEVPTFANVTFSNVSQTSTNVGKITWGNRDDTIAGSSEIAIGAYPSSDPFGGDIWFNTTYINQNYSIGEPYNTVFMHELGHALGLKHSFAIPNPLTGAEDSYKYTVMAYHDGFPNKYPVSYMLYDIAALQYMYGANMNYNSGNNTYSLTYLSDTRCIWDGGGLDTLDASASKDRVNINLNSGSFSSIGHDMLGGLSIDNLSIAYNCIIENANGGSGNDTITGNSVANTIMGNAGNDYLYGKDGNDTLYGGDGNDYLIGGNGHDILNGGNGNDNYYIDSIGVIDTIIDSGGIDTVYIDVSNSGSYTMAAGIENLYLTTIVPYTTFQINGNSLNNEMRGDSYSNIFYGNDGNDTIYGYGGDDKLYGGNGNDYLSGDAGNDFIMGGAGADTINGGDGMDTASYSDSTAGVNINLAAATASGGYATGDKLINIENIIGSSHNDTLIGNALANIITGGAGKDIMTGGAGNDYFKFSSVTDSGKTSSTIDIITDFVNGTGKSGDEIDLTDFAGTFVFKGTAAFTHTAHEVNYAHVGGNTFINVDVDGNGVLDFQIELAGLHNMTAVDFLL